jgi:hypothetical protein
MRTRPWHLSVILAPRGQRVLNALRPVRRSRGREEETQGSRYTDTSVLLRVHLAVGKPGANHASTAGSWTGTTARAQHGRGGRSLDLS